MNQRKLKVLDLFSGIGGFALGLDSTGIFETVKFVEKDKYCQKVLQKNFPNIPIEEDIKNVEGKEGDADVVVGGFPCQPMSVAGKRKGTDDDRYLWPEMFRLIKQIKPQFVIGENVQGIINIQNGMVLRQVQDDLESEGFEVQCFLIPASGFGSWHQRNRVWIIGHSKTNGLLKAEYESNVSNTIGKLSNGCSGTTRDSKKEFIRLECNEGWHWNQVRSEVERCSEQDLQHRQESNTNTHGSRLKECDVPDQSEGEVDSSGQHVKEQHTKTWWQIESDLCGIPNGISRELDKDRASRIKSLGNAIVPQMARIFGLAIKKVLQESE